VGDPPPVSVERHFAQTLPLSPPLDFRHCPRGDPGTGTVGLVVRGATVMAADLDAALDRYSRSGYGSTATASTETISSGHCPEWPRTRRLRDLRFSLHLRVFGGLGKQRDVVLLADA
jgi:hypothetical protein